MPAPPLLICQGSLDFVCLCMWLYICGVHGNGNSCLWPTQAQFSIQESFLGLLLAIICIYIHLVSLIIICDDITVTLANLYSHDSYWNAVLFTTAWGMSINVWNLYPFAFFFSDFSLSLLKHWCWCLLFWKGSLCICTCHSLFATLPGNNDFFMSMLHLLRTFLEY